MWASDEWRQLPMCAQWLYTHLLSSPTLSYAGVADWRPARIAKMCQDATAASIESAALHLERDLLLVIDRDTEEALIRSYVRNDGILAKPNVAIAFAKAWQAVASAPIRGVVAYELERLEYDQSHANAWSNKDSKPWLDTILRSDLVTPEEAFDTVTPNPSVKGSTKGLRGVK